MILVWLILLPLIGGLLSWQSERFSQHAPRWVALITMLACLGLSVQLWLAGDYSLPVNGVPHWSVEYQCNWIPAFGISFHLGLDGISLLMVVLTNLLGVLAVVCSWREIHRYVGFFHLNLLWNLAGVAGVFLALDLFLFFFFWEMMLVPMFFLIALWGHNDPNGKTRVHSAIKFFIYTQASGLIMLLSIIGLALLNARHTGHLSFDYMVLLNTKMSATAEWWLMLGFFIAFAVKMPIVPLHSWLADAHAQAPTAGSLDLAGILLKTAAYGMLRFMLPMFPHASAEIAPLAMWLGVVGVIYGAMVAFAQTDIKRLVANSNISHMGFIVIGIFAGTQLALQGVIVQMIASGLSSAGLFTLCGVIYDRMGTRDMREMGGVWSRMRFLPPIMLFFGVASLGMPGLGNFIGEFLTLLGSYQVAPVVTIVSSLGLILAAAYALILVQRVLHGSPAGAADGATLPRLAELGSRELTMMVSLMVLLLLLGLYPQPVMDVAAGTVSAVRHAYTGIGGAL